MRGGRSFLVLLVVALGLGAYIYFVESKRDPAGASVVAGEKVFGIETGTIEEVRIEATSGERTTVRKTGDRWQIVEPAALEADTTAVSSLASTLESLESERTVDENPESVAAYGLEPPRLTVAFKVAGEPVERRLLIGERTPTGSDLYARVEGDPKLILIASYIEDSLNKTTFDLRDKSVLKFARDGIDAISLEPADAPAVTLARSGDDWRLSAPAGAAADYSTVDGLIGRLFQARMQAIVSPADPASAAEPSPDDLRTYGLDRPAVVVHLGAGSTRASLAVGAAHDSTTRYARDLSRPLVFTVESSLVDDLTKKPDDLRSKDVFAFRSFTALGVDVAAGGATVTFAKTPAPEGAEAPANDTWKQTAPAEKDVDQTKLTDLLTTLSNLRAQSFAARAHAGGEEVVVTARFGEAASPTEERVVFRKSGDVVHAIREGEPGAAVVSTEDFDRALSLFKELTGASGQ
jgi:hypothetical protein